MAHKIADRIRETTITTGTGAYALGGAASALYHTFASFMSDGDTTEYLAIGSAGVERGLGTLNGSTLERTIVFDSSNSNSAVDWGVGTKTILVPPCRRTNPFIFGPAVGNIQSSVILGLTAQRNITFSDTDHTVATAASVTAEASARAAADSAEATARAAGDSAEATARAAADTALTTAYQAADASEASARAAADSAITTAYQAADTTLQTNITAEASARSTADTLRVLKAGDTMTGQLLLQKTSPGSFTPTLIIRPAAGEGDIAVLDFQTAGGTTAVSIGTTGDLRFGTLNRPKITGSNLTAYSTWAMKLGSTGNVSWASGTDGDGTQDVNISRTAAGTLAVGTGAQGNKSGTLQLGGIDIYDGGGSNRTMILQCGGTGAGTAKLYLTASANIALGSSNTDANTPDTNLSRISAGVWGVGTGAQGSVAGSMQMATLAINGATIGTDKLAVTGSATISGAVNCGNNARFLAVYAYSTPYSAGAGFTSPSDGVMKIHNWDITDFNRLCFGGTTSSFPALKRSSTTLAVRLADDSADAPLTCGTLDASGQIMSSSNVRSTLDTICGGDFYFKTGSSTPNKTRIASPSDGVLVISNNAGTQTLTLTNSSGNWTVDLSGGTTSFTGAIGFTGNLIGGATSELDIRQVQFLSSGGLNTSLIKSNTDGDFQITNVSITGLNNLFLGVSGGATCTAIRQKAVASIADNTATDVLTVTIPNTAQSACIEVDLLGRSGAGGSIGADESAQLAKYLINVTRTAGVNAVVAIGAILPQPAAVTVAGGNAVAVTGSISSVSGAVGATNTFTIKVTIARAGGTATNHTCTAIARLLNANASGITIS